MMCRGFRCSGGPSRRRDPASCAEWEASGRVSDQEAWQAPLHVHHEDDEAWYVLSGTLRLRIDGEDYDVPAVSGIVGPRGVPHTFGNPGEEPARYVLVISAKTHAMLGELHGGFSGDVAALFEKVRVLAARVAAVSPAAAGPRPARPRRSGCT